MWRIQEWEELKINQHKITDWGIGGMVVQPESRQRGFWGDYAELNLSKRLKAEEKGVTEADWLEGITNGHELGQTLGDGEGQGSLACYSPRGCRVRQDLMTEQQQCQACF